MKKQLSQHEVNILAYELNANKMLPLKGLCVGFNPRKGLHTIRFVNEDKQLDIGLISKHRKYDDKAIEKQLKDSFLGSEE